MTQTPYKCKYFQARKMACIEVHFINEKKTVAILRLWASV